MARVRITSEGARYYNLDDLRQSPKVRAVLEADVKGLSNLDQPGGEGSFYAQEIARIRAREADPKPKSVLLRQLMLRHEARRERSASQATRSRAGSRRRP